MRRLIAAAVLFIIVIGSYIGSYFYIDKTCEKTNKLLEECISAYDNQADPSSAAKKLEDFWSKKEKSLSFIVNHTKIDDIEAEIGSLIIYSNTDQNELFYEHSETVKTLLHQLMEDTVPSIHSIF